MGERKIIFVNRVYWPDESATAQLLSDLAPAMAARGWKVQVIAGGTGPERHGEVLVHRTGGKNSVRGWARLGSYLRFLLGARARLATLVAPGDIVILKTDPPLLAAVGTGAARRRGGRVVQWIQDIYPEIVVAHQGRWLSPLLAPLRWWRDRAWRRSARCAVVGEDMLTPVRNAGVGAEAIRHLPNWAPRELDQPPAAEAVRSLRRTWGWEGRFVIAYSGNLGRVHEFNTALEAAGVLRGAQSPVFLFIGDGPRRREVQAASERRGLDNVRFLPPVPRAELATSLAAADAHLVTLRPGFETLVHPSKLAGILASGRPAVFVGAPDCALARFLLAEEAGGCVAAGGAEALAGLLARLRDQPELCARLGGRARAAYERHFRFATATEEWDRLLREVAAGECPLP